MIQRPRVRRQSTEVDDDRNAVTRVSTEHACGFDRSQLYSDEGLPMRAIAANPWVEQALGTVAWIHQDFGDQA